MRRIQRLACVASATALSLASLGIAAQPADSEEAIDEVVITGSQIRGVAPVGSTVISVGREELEASGALTVSDALKEVPQITGLGVDESHRGAQGGAQNIFYNNQVNIRSLGPQATLTLLNGHRAPSTGTSGFSLDPSVFPTLALERVEIVADGASATYGSDAIAGVANLITRRNFEGAEVMLRGGVAADNNTLQGGFIIGHRWDRLHGMLAYEYSKRDELIGFDRDYVRANLVPEGGTNYAPNQCNPGTIVANTPTATGVRYAIPAGGVTQATAGSLVANTRNTCDTYGGRGLLPLQKRSSLYAAGGFDFSDRLRVYADGYLYRRDFKLESPTSLPSITVTVPNTNPNFVLPPGATGTSVQVEWFIPTVGDGIDHTGRIDSYQGNVGAQYEFASDWQAEVSYSYGSDHSQAQYLQLNAGNQTTLLAGNTALGALNPFAAGVGSNSPAIITALYDNLFYAPGRNTQQIVQGKVDGKLFELPGGALRTAVGIEYRDEKLTTGNSSGPAAARIDVRLFPERTVTSAFAELLVPVFGDGNALPLLRKLDIDLAVRREEYSDVGAVTKPKFGLNWSPFEDLMVHASYGKSFRAPTLANFVSTNAGFQVTTVFDPTVNRNVGTLFLNEANPDVQPETAETYSLGFDWTPSVLPGLQASVNWFDIDYRNQIQNLIGNLTVLQQEALYPGLVIRNPSAAFLAPYLARLQLRGGALPNPVAAFIDARPQNLGVTLATGYDLILKYQWPATSWGRFTTGINGSYFTRYRVKQTANSPLLSQVGQLNFPQRYRAQLRVGWLRAPFDATLWIDQLDGYTNGASIPVQQVASSTIFNLHGGYTIGDGSLPWLNGVTVAVDAYNLFDRDPPFVNIAGGFDPNAASALGRQLLLTLTKKF